MTETDKLLVRIGTARDAISMKTEQTSLDYMIDGVLMNCSVLLKDQEDLGTELMNAVELIHKKNERIEKLLKEQEEEILNLRRENHNILTQFHEWAKEQEAKQPNMMQDVEGIWSTCPTCGHKLRAILAMKMNTYFPKYCSECGQAVKWNE